MSYLLSKNLTQKKFYDKPNTIHKTMEITCQQMDKTSTTMKITINENQKGIIWVGFEVDGKHFVADAFLKEFRDTLNNLSE